MKEKYLSPTVLNANNLELSVTKRGAGVLPVLQAIAAAATAGFALGKSLKNVIGVTTPCERFLTLTKGRNVKDDFCMA